MRDELSKWGGLIQDLQSSKADGSELEKLEQIIMNRINEFITALSKQFADKAETKKALKLLER